MNVQDHEFYDNSGKELPACGDSGLDSIQTPPPSVEAKGYYNSMIPGARGKANDTITKADAYKIETVNRAVGESQKFEAMLLEYQRDSQVYSQSATKYRLLLETLEKTLPRVKKYIVNASTKEVNVKLFDPKSGIMKE